MSVDYSEIRQLRDAVDNINSSKDQIISSIAKELAARLLREVIKRTPSGKNNYMVVISRTYDPATSESKIYRNNKGKVKATRHKISGGTLKRGWGVNENVLMFGNTYVMNINNNVFYAAYVEYGHRQTPGRYVPAIGKRLKRSWVPGRHMLQLSVDDIQKKAPAIIEKRLAKWLNEVMQ